MKTLSVVVFHIITYQNKEVKRLKKLLSITLSIVLAMSFLVMPVFAAEEDSKKDIPIISEKFVAESEYSITSDSNGEPVIILTNVEQLSSNFRSAENHYAQTSVAIWPSDEQELEEIIASIESIKSSNRSGTTGNHTEQGWFYGSSVYLTSTIYYYTTVVDSKTYKGMSSVDISCSVNNGTSISTMVLDMYQVGIIPNGATPDQTKRFDAKTQRSFSVPSNWQPVFSFSTANSIVGADITATAVRQSGSSTFTLVHRIH